MSNHVLVRVQPSFQGLENDNGTLSIKRIGDSNRNTIHFCVNGTVGSHEFGDWDNCGVVIIAKPGEIKAPVSGVRLEDTWMHVGKNGLDLGESAIILAPEGLEVPQGLEGKVKFYPVNTKEEIMAARDLAVAKELDDFGVIDKYQIGRNSIHKNDSHVNISEYYEICDEVKTKFKFGGPMTTDQHMNTLDCRLEDLMASMASKVNRLKTFGRVEVVDGISRNMDDMLLQTIDEAQQNIVLANNKLNGYAEHYYQNLTYKLNEAKEEVLTIQKQYGQESDKRFVLVSDTGVSGHKSEGEVIQFIDNLAKKPSLHSEFDKVRVIDRTLQEGIRDRDLGSLSEVFDREVRKAKIANRQVMKSIEEFRANIEQSNLGSIIKPPPLPSN